MGFSVSGAAAIIFLSTFVAFGMLYTAADNSFQNVLDAEDDRADRTLEAKNTALNVTGANFTAGDGDDELTITANNTGATVVSLAATDLLVDNVYRQGWEANASVDGNQQTDLWLPGETLSITVTVDGQPDRVSVTTGSGVSATAEVVA